MEETKKEIIEAVKEELGKEVEVSFAKVGKNNGTEAGVCHSYTERKGDSILRYMETFMIFRCLIATERLFVVK